MADGLFSDIPDKVITAYDLHGKTHQRDLRNFKFRASVYGILIRNGQILLKRSPLIEQFELPGGGIELDETIEPALLREFEEETGITIKVKKLLGAEDSFFTFNGSDAHGILLFYEVEETGGTLAPKHGDSVEAKFFDIQSLGMENVQRAFQNIIGGIKAEYQ